MSPQPTTDTTFEQDVLKSQGVTLVDFWAPWCGPCRTQGPILDRYGAANADVRIIKHNTESDPMVPGHFGVQSIPTLIVFVDGKPIVGSVGLHDEKGLDALIQEAKKRAAEPAKEA